MGGHRTELTTKSLLKAFKAQGGVVTLTKDGHLKVYKQVADGYLFLGKLAHAGNSASEANKRGLIAVRAVMRRNGFDV